jgi:UDP-N-acetylmuramoylalanine--D-glutamate ligase
MLVSIRIKSMKILIIGYGVSGKSAEALLLREGHEVIVLDRKKGLPDRPDFPLEGIDQIVISPGVALTHPIVQRAQAAGIEVIGEMELGARRLVKNRCFGVTGANGKTTTVLLTEHVLNACGVKAKALGNVGEPISSYAGDDVVIVELSSFQLETLDAKFLEAAIVLNITPNHLDRYPSMKEYAEAKARIRGCLKTGGELFVSEQVEREWGELFAGAQNFEVASKVSLEYTPLEMPSKQSVQAALLLCRRCGVTDDAFLRSLKTYQKPAHRIEFVAKINGVPYYNDSKASNIHSVLHAVERLEGPIVLIAGGLHKGSSYKPWLQGFGGKVKEIIAYGQAAELMEFELAPHIPLKKVGPFKEAVWQARLDAKGNDTVLLSPGCSSYDQFASYEERGNEFKRLVGEMV